MDPNEFSRARLLERYPIYNNNPGITRHTVLSSFEENPHDDSLQYIQSD